MFLVRFFLEHKFAAKLLMVLLICFGLYALININTHLFPPVKQNEVRITIDWPNANASSVEKAITAPLEHRLQSLKQLKNMTSRSVFGKSQIQLKFSLFADMHDVMQAVRSAVNSEQLPANAKKPVIKQVEIPDLVASVLISAPTNLRNLIPIANNAKKQLQQLGITSIIITGVPSQQLVAAVSLNSAKTLNTTHLQLSQHLQKSFKSAPVGLINQNVLGKNLQGKADVSEKTFGNALIPTNNQQHTLQLKDISQIHHQFDRSGRFIFYNNQPAVALYVYRSANEHTLELSKTLENWVSKEQSKLGAKYTVKIYNDSSVYITRSMKLLASTGLQGLLLILGILILALNFRIAIWVTVGIGAAILGTIGIYYFLGGSLNLVSLFALLVALGIIVDDSIVISEEALHLRKNLNMSPFDAARRAAKKPSIIAASATTIVAYIPLLYIPGEIGQFLSQIPLVIIAIMLASTLECFLVLPNHLYSALKHVNVADKTQRPQPLNIIKVQQHKLLEFAKTKLYHPVLSFSVRYHWLTILFAILLFILSTGLITGRHLAFSYFPQPSRRILVAQINTSPGTTRSNLMQISNHTEKAFYKALHSLNINKTNDILVIKFLHGNLTRDTLPNQVSLAAELPESLMGKQSAIAKEWKKLIPQSSHMLHVSVNAPPVGPAKKDIDILLSLKEAHKDQLSLLKHASMQLESALRNISGVTSVSSDTPYGRKRLLFSLNAKASELGMTPEYISKQLYASLHGIVIKTIYQHNHKIDLVVRLPETERNNITYLNSIPIKTPAGKIINFSDIATLQSERSLQSINRYNDLKTITISATIDNKKTTSDKVLRELRRTTLSNLESNYPINIKPGTQLKEQADIIKSLGIKFILALLFIYLILVWKFQSLTRPFLVLFSIPLGLTGVLFGHWLLGFNISYLSIIGLFALSGIVVNDSIILISCYDILVNREKLSVQEALVKAPQLRSRAVLLTSLTTIVGLMPFLLFYDYTTSLLVPMAATIIFGMLFVSLLVLFIVPALLAVDNDIRQFLHKLRLYFNRPN